MTQLWMSISSRQTERNHELPLNLPVSLEGNIDGTSLRFIMSGCCASSTSVSGGSSKSDNHALSCISASDITIEINSLSSSILIQVPLTALTGIYLQTEPGGLKLSTDLRLLYNSGMQLDQRALYSLLQFGAMIQPLTPWRQISRLTPGKVYDISGDDLNMASRTCSKLCASGDPADGTLPALRQCEELATTSRSYGMQWAGDRHYSWQGTWRNCAQPGSLDETGSRRVLN